MEEFDIEHQRTFADDPEKKDVTVIIYEPFIKESAFIQRFSHYICNKALQSQASEISYQRIIRMN